MYLCVCVCVLMCVCMFVFVCVCTGVWHSRRVSTSGKHSLGCRAVQSASQCVCSVWCLSNLVGVSLRVSMIVYVCVCVCVSALVSFIPGLSWPRASTRSGCW